jgi:hypothetical protein
MAKKVGRPKNPRIRTLENKVEALLSQLEEVEQKAALDINEDSLPCLGMGCIQKQGKYYLQVIKYDPNSKLAKVVDEQEIADAQHRADFELRKYMTYNFKYEEME